MALRIIKFHKMKEARLSNKKEFYHRVHREHRERIRFLCKNLCASLCPLWFLFFLDISSALFFAKVLPSHAASLIPYEFLK